MSYTLHLYVSEFATTVTDSFINHPTSESAKRLTALIKRIMLHKSINKCWFHNSSTLLILKSLKKILISIRDTVVPREKELVRHLDDLLCHITPKDMAIASGTTADGLLKDLIDAVPIYNSEVCDGDEFFDFLIDAGISIEECDDYICLYSIIQRAKHLICLNNGDWSFMDLSYVAIEDDSMTLWNHEFDQDSLYDRNYLNFNIHGNYNRYAEPPKNVLRQSGIEGEENCSGELFILRSVNCPDIEQRLLHVNATITHFTTQLSNIRKSDKKLQQSDLLYIVKFIAAFNILMKFIGHTYPNNSKLIESCMSQAKILMNLLNYITVSEISLLKENNLHIIKHLVTSTQHSDLALHSDMRTILEDISKRGRAMFKLCLQNEVLNTDTVGTLQRAHMFNDESISDDDDVLPSGPRRPLHPDQIPPAYEETLRLNLGSFSSLEQFLSVNDDNTCAICHGNWRESTDVAILPNCSHIFCLECLKKWFSPGSSCEE